MNSMEELSHEFQIGDQIMFNKRTSSSKLIDKNYRKGENDIKQRDEQFLWKNLAIKHQLMCKSKNKSYQTQNPIQRHFRLKKREIYGKDLSLQEKLIKMQDHHLKQNPRLLDKKIIVLSIYRPNPNDLKKPKTNHKESEMQNIASSTYQLNLFDDRLQLVQNIILLSHQLLKRKQSKFEIINQRMKIKVFRFFHSLNSFITKIFMDLLYFDHHQYDGVKISTEIQQPQIKQREDRQKNSQRKTYTNRKPSFLHFLTTMSMKRGMLK